MFRRVGVSFLVQGGRVLLAPCPYLPGRLNGLCSEEDASLAGARARAALVLAGAEPELLCAGLPVDLEVVVKRRGVPFRVHPYAFALPPGLTLRVGTGDELVWIHPDAIIPRAAVGETFPELDEVVSRVLDAPSALPPPFRDAARALVTMPPGRELVAAGVALVAQGAPPARVAALRPGRAWFHAAARAATDLRRDVIGEWVASQERALGRVEASRAAGLRAAIADAVSAAGEALVDGAVGPLDEVIVTPWNEWRDDVLPPAEPGQVVVVGARLLWT